MSVKKIRGGATIWARQTIDSDVFFWRPDKWFKIWFYIVNKVNHQDSKLFKRGSNFMTYEEISRSTKASKNQIDGFVRYSKSQLMLTTQKTTRGMVVSVLKYDFFQDLNNYRNDTENDIVTETETKHNRSITDTINNNDNNDKNDNNGTTSEVNLAGNETNKVLSLFKDVNPTYEQLFKNTTQRKALERLIGKFGADKVSRMIQSLSTTNKEQYAPVITTPVQLETNLGKLVAFIQKRSNESKTIRL